MKLVTSDRRTLLKESTLSDCLMIKLQGESIKDFNPDKAINVWFEKPDRSQEAVDLRKTEKVK